MAEVEVEVRGIAATADGGEQPLLVLQERPDPRRCLLIWIGGFEARAVTEAGPDYSGPVPPRPLTPRLLLDVLAGCGAALARVRITGIVSGQFHAELDLAPAAPEATGTRGPVAGWPVVVSARASDAVTLGRLRGCPILVAAAVLEQAGVPADRFAARPGPDTPAATPSPAAPAAEDPAHPDAAIEEQVERLRAALTEATPDDFRPDTPGSDPGE